MTRLRAIRGGRDGSGQEGAAQTVHDVEAERDVLAAVMLVDPEESRRVLGLVPMEAWYSERHRAIAEAMHDVAAEGLVVEVVSVSIAMKAAGTWERWGGARCISELLDHVGVVSNVDHYAAEVVAKWRLRQALEAATEIQASVVAGDDVAEVAARARARLDALAERPEVEVPFASRVTAYVAELGQPEALRPRLGTGIPELDRRLNGGLVAGQLVVIQAAGKVGKTLLACNGIIPATCGALMRPGAALLVSLEMGEGEHMARWLARETGGYVPTVAQEKRNLQPEQWAAMNEAADRIARWRLSYDNRSRSMDAIAAAARAAKKRHGDLSLVVVDGLTQVSNPDLEGNRTADIDYTTRGLKQLAVELDAVVVLTVHVDKNAATSGKVGLYDGRGSSGPANDANVVLIPFRDGAQSGVRIFGRSVPEGEMELGSLCADWARMAFVEG